MHAVGAGSRSLWSRLAVALSAALLLAALLHGTVTAAVLWTLTATPLTTASGQRTTFTLKATNLSPVSRLGCVMVNVTSSFTIHSAAITGVSNGGTWLASASGRTVTIRAEDGGDRLDRYLLPPADWVQFTVSATGQAQGVWRWEATAYEDQGCSGTPFLDVLPVVITVTSPSSTSTPSSSPTPIPTIPVPLPTLPPPPDILPSPLPTSTPRPTAPPTRSPAPTASPTPSATPPDARGPSTPSPAPSDGTTTPTRDAEPSGDPGPVVAVASPRPSGAPRGAAFVLGGGDDPAGDLRLGAALGDLAGSLLVVSLPVLVFSVPGLLIILLVLLQVMGAAVWIPIVRRFRQPEQYLGPAAFARPAATPARPARLRAWIRFGKR